MNKFFRLIACVVISTIMLQGCFSDEPKESDSHVGVSQADFDIKVKGKIWKECKWEVVCKGEYVHEDDRSQIDGWDCLNMNAMYIDDNRYIKFFHPALKPVVEPYDSRVVRDYIYTPEDGKLTIVHPDGSQTLWMIIELVSEDRIVTRRYFGYYHVHVNEDAPYGYETINDPNTYMRIEMRPATDEEAQAYWEWPEIDSFH